jgi:hypothetical protein
MSPTMFCSNARRRSPRARPLAVLAALVLSGACRSSGAPEIEGPASPLADGETVYVLRTVAGSPVPAVVLDNGYAVVTFLADTLRLQPDGSGVQVVVERTRDSGQPETESSEVRPLTYTVAGSRIAISIVCPPTALMLCAAPPHYRGTLTPTGLRLERALEYRVPLVYERVDE